MKLKISTTAFLIRVLELKHSFCEKDEVQLFV